MRLRAVWLLAGVVLVGGACSHPHVQLDASASTTTSAGAASPLPLTYGLSRFDPPGDAQPRMTAAEALSAWTSGGHRAPGGSGPEVLFALYSDSGSGQMRDNGLTARDHFNQPVWMIRYQNVADTERGGPRFGGIASSTTAEILVDVVDVIDDATGAVVLSVSGVPNEPSDSPPKSCPEDFSTFTNGLVDDGGTPLPSGGTTGSFTQPHATILASDGDAYSVWGGIGSLEHPATESSSDGVLVVSHSFKDPCKSPPTKGGIVFHHEPSQSGVVTVTGIAGDSVRYRTANGTTGTYNVVTEVFSSR